jgi:CBS domain-containing protein
MAMGPATTDVAARIGQGFAFLFVLLGLFYNPILMLVGIFIYFAAGSEQQASAFNRFASQLRVRDAMEPSPALLRGSDPLSRAVDLLLSTPQRDFPVIDDHGAAIGLLDREAMLIGLKTHGRRGRCQDDARVVASPGDVALAAADMRSRGVKAEAVSDRGGRIVGILTVNIAEMMMVKTPGRTGVSPATIRIERNQRFCHLTGAHFIEPVGNRRPGLVMGDDDNGILPRQVGDVANDLRFRRRIECAGHFIKNQHSGFLHQRTRERNSLALAAGQLAAHFSDIGVETRRQSINESRGASGLRAPEPHHRRSFRHPA